MRREEEEKSRGGDGERGVKKCKQVKCGKSFEGIYCDFTG